MNENAKNEYKIQSTASKFIEEEKESMARFVDPSSEEAKITRYGNYNSVKDYGESFRN